MKARSGEPVMDMLFLEGLEVPCRVGCTDPERATPQSLRVEVQLFCGSLRDAALADDLERTVDYRLAGDMIAAVQGREFLLIERVAETLCEGRARQPARRSRHHQRQEAAAGAGPRVGGSAHHARSRRMRVVSNTAISLDGRINTRERRFTFFGSPRDHARMSLLRSEADAVLVGGATFRNWPHPSLPDDGDRARLQGRPWNVVVTRTLDVPLRPEFLAEPAIRPLFLTRAGSVPDDFRPRSTPGAGKTTCR
jgi:dihydroneopterin aldolase